MTMSFLSDFSPVKLIPFVVLIAAVIFIAICFTSLIKNLPPKAALVLMFCGLAVFFIALMFIILPKSPLSLFAPDQGTGRDEVSVSEDGKLIVRIREDSIFLGHVRVENPTALVTDILGDPSETDNDIVLTDDYALSSTWNEVTKALAENGITWSEETVK